VCECIPFLISPVKQLSREPPGKTPEPVSTKPSAEAPRASRRARRRARLELNPPPKYCERALEQDTGPASNHPPKRYTSEPSGKPPGPSRTACAAT